jgi:hypothetical protein
MDNPASRGNQVLRTRPSSQSLNNMPSPKRKRASTKNSGPEGNLRISGRGVLGRSHLDRRDYVEVDTTGRSTTSVREATSR